MGDEKRKLGLDDDEEVAAGPQKKARKDNGDVTGAADEEVDEFFAILRRLHVAVNYFKKDKGVNEGRNVKESVAALEMELKTCTNRESNGVKDVTTGVADEDGVGVGVGEKQNGWLDLNADPVTDP